MTTGQAWVFGSLLFGIFAALMSISTELEKIRKGRR